MAYTNAVMNTPSFLATPPSCAEKNAAFHGRGAYWMRLESRHMNRNIV